MNCNQLSENYSLYSSSVQNRERIEREQIDFESSKDLLHHEADVILVFLSFPLFFSQVFDLKLLKQTD